ncbi:BRO family protein [Telmatospirillum sp. J64-1]|uniref:BRO-N domain-containing protein n=1 Tax=Telmatospirillum sp. J64-1 TaxID=2502183 RepID=UPI00115E311E|nr:BRO family protein [Telmatospirillum sp. J64-1]
MTKTNLSTFTFNTSSIRVVTIDGEPWFVAKDVCIVLGLKGYPSFHTAKLDRSEVQNIPVSKAKNLRLADLFGPKVPVVALISESGLYKLVMRSDKPQAKPFQDWVTKVVLPAIRKDGGYILGEEKVVTGEMDEDALVLRAFEVLKRKVDRLTTERDTLAAIIETELNLVTIDEFRALLHQYWDPSYRARVASKASRLAKERGLKLEKQERDKVIESGKTIKVYVNVYPRALLEEVVASLA